MDCHRRLPNSLHRTRQPRVNGYCESVNSKLRDELLAGEIFYSLAEARVLIEARGIITTLYGRTAR